MQDLLNPNFFIHIVLRADIEVVKNKIDNQYIIIDECDDEASLLASLAERLKFPSYFGNNWDAVLECLVDIPLNSQDNLTLVIDNLDLLLMNSPSCFIKLSSTWLHAAKIWKENDNVSLQLILIL